MANLPLHGGKGAAYLFQRMVRLAGAMTMAIVEEYGPEEMLRRLADTWWFQAFGLCARIRQALVRRDHGDVWGI